MTEQGYDKSRFPNLQGELFDCIICNKVVKKPKECQGCGNLFCDTCITRELQNKKACPNKCTANITYMTAKALINIYNDLDFQCDKCKKTMKLGDFPKHEMECGRPKCTFAENCNGFSSGVNQFNNFCSERCKILGDIIATKGDAKLIYEIVSKISEKNVGMEKLKSISPGTTGTNLPLDKIILQWNKYQCGMNIELSNENTAAYLKEEAYIFRTIIATQPFMSGKHYWEIHADSRTENELKIGVSSSNSFDFNTSFSDHKFGFSYYGLGQLRHGSNSAGGQYGKRFKKTGVLGIYLNMDKGTLSFCLNGEDFGIAYDDPELRKGPLYAAVALLHCSGCIIKGELPIPRIYESK